MKLPLQALSDGSQSERTIVLDYSCIDMYKPYLSVITANSGQAIHTLHRNHVVATITQDIGIASAKERRKMTPSGYKALQKVISKKRLTNVLT